MLWFCRAKFSEAAFLDVYQKLYEAPDPAQPLLNALVNPLIALIGFRINLSLKFVWRRRKRIPRAVFSERTASHHGQRGTNGHGLSLLGKECQKHLRTSFLESTLFAVPLVSSQDRFPQFSCGTCPQCAYSLGGK